VTATKIFAKKIGEGKNGLRDIVTPYARNALSEIEAGQLLRAFDLFKSRGGGRHRERMCRGGEATVGIGSVELVTL